MWLRRVFWVCFVALLVVVKGEGEENHPPHHHPGSPPLLLLSFPVGLSDGSEHTLEFFSGDHIDSVVEAFASSHSLSDPLKAALFAEAKTRAQAARLIPMLSVPLLKEDEKDPFLTVDIYSDDNLLEVTHAQCTRAGLTESEIREAQDAVIERAISARLIPLLKIDVNDDTEEKNHNHLTFEVYDKDNITQVAHAFAQSHHLGDAAATQLEKSAIIIAKRRRLMPLLTLPVQVDQTSAEVAMFDGDDVNQVVARYAAAYQLTESAQKTLHRAVTEAALDAKILPVLSLPVEVNDLPLLLHIYRNETPQEAVRAFLQSIGGRGGGRGGGREGEEEEGRREGGEGEEEGRREGGEEGGEEFFSVLVEHVKMVAIRERLYPALQLEVEVDDGSHQLIRIYHGDDIPRGVEHFAATYGLSEQGASALLDEIRTRGQLVGLTPVLSAPVKLPDGATIQFNLYQNQNVTDAVIRFTEQHNTTQYTNQLLNKVLLQAKHKRLVPELHLKIRVRGKGEQALQIFHGDDVLEKTSEFISKHGLNETEAQLVRRGVIEQAKRQRIIPKIQLEFSAMSRAGEAVKAAKFYLYAGETIEEAVKAMVEEYDLDVGQGTGDIIAQVKRALEEKEEEEEEEEEEEDEKILK